MYFWGHHLGAQGERSLIRGLAGQRARLDNAAVFSDPDSMSRPLTHFLSRKGFRVLAFAVALLLLFVSYWLGNQFKKTDAQAEALEFQAQLLEPAQRVAEFQVVINGTGLPFASLVDDWTFVLPGRLDQDLNRGLAQAWNRLALEPRIQSRMRVWLLDGTDVAVPEFIKPLVLDTTERKRAGETFAEGSLYLVNPKGQLRAIFHPGQSAASLAHDFEYILNQVSP